MFSRPVLFALGLAAIVMVAAVVFGAWPEREPVREVPPAPAFVQ